MSPNQIKRAFGNIERLLKRVGNWTTRPSKSLGKTIEIVEKMTKKEIMKNKDPNKYPPGLDARRVQEIIDHYENQTEEEAFAEDEAFRRRTNELRRQKLSKEEIDRILEQEAEALSRIGEPKQFKKQATILQLSPKWLEKAKFVAALHNFSDYRDWIRQVVKERLQLEESLIRGLKKNATNGNNNKRRTTERTVVAK